MLFYSFFKTLVGKQITVELKNDLEIRGTLVSVDQYLNIKLESVSVLDEEKYPHMKSVRDCFVRGSVVRYVQPPEESVDVDILHDATTVGRWLRSCYFPQLFDKPIESTKSIIQKGLDAQNEEMKNTKCRSYNLWNSFDRPVQYTYYCGRTFEKEIYEADLLSCSGKSGGISISSPIRRWMYSWSCASSLLVPATQHGAGCGVQAVKEWEPGSLEQGAIVQRALRTPSPLPPHLRRERVRWGVAMAVGCAPERRSRKKD